MPKLGFKLLIRKLKWRCKFFFSKYLFKYLNSILTIILTVIGIYYARQSNELSKLSFQLAKNDTSQQSQIDNLNKIVNELKDQNRLMYIQNYQLLEIAKQTNSININSYNLLEESIKQSGLTYKQYKNNLRKDSLNEVEGTLLKEADLLIFRKIFEEVRDVNMVQKVGMLGLDSIPNLNTVTDLRNKFEKGLNNKVFLQDSVIKSNWYKFYKYLKIAEDHLKVFYANNMPQHKRAEAKNHGKNIVNFYITTINLIWKRLDYLEEEFKAKNFISQ